MSDSIRKHVEAAVAKAGPGMSRASGFCRFLFGIAETLFAIRGGRSVTLPDYAKKDESKKKIFDANSLRVCVENAMSMTGAPASKTCIVGLSIGAYEAYKARLPHPLVSISNGYDLETAKKALNRVVWRYASRLIPSTISANLSCVEELLSCSRPTLLINSRNDPIVPKQCLDIGDSVAYANPNVASVTTARGGHLGFVDDDGKRWAYEVSMDFLQSVVG